jgi:hypothetical protein
MHSGNCQLKFFQCHSRGPQHLSRTSEVVGIALSILTWLLVISPMALTSRTYPDSGIHLWLLWQQQLNISELGLPTLFVSGDRVGDLYPMLAYAGGTINAIGAAISIALGDRPIVAYDLLRMMSVAAALIGFLSLSRALGVRRFWSYVPGIIYVTSAYLLTNIYGRGATAEFIATAWIPVCIGASLWFLRTQGRKRIAYLLAASLSMTIISGTHTITLVLISITCLGALFATAIYLAWPSAPKRSPRQFDWKSSALLMAALLGGIGLNSWFMVPGLVTASSTAVGRYGGFNLEVSSWFSDPGMVLSIARISSPESGNSMTPWLFAQVPTLAIAWIILALTFTYSRRSHNYKITVLMVFLAGTIGILLHPSVFLEFPHPLRSIQFSYRLTTYATLFVCVLLSLMLKRSILTKWARGFLIGLTLVAITQAGLQVWETKGSAYSESKIVSSVSRVPTAVYAISEFASGTLPIVTNAPHGRVVKKSRARVEYLLDRPRSFTSSVVGDPRLFTIDGAVVVGVSSKGRLVLSAYGKRVAVSSDSYLARIGAWLTIFSGITVVLVAVLAMRPSRQQRSAVPASAPRH